MMVLTSDDAVIRALQRHLGEPSTLHDIQLRRDGFVELLLAFADAEDDEEPVPVQAHAAARPMPSAGTAAAYC